MARIDGLDHPAVELPLPLDGETHEFEIPRDRTLFCWTALAVGTPTRIPPIRSPLGSRLFNEGVDHQERMWWSISIDGTSAPLITDSYYREDRYKGLVWWTACDPVELPATVRVGFELQGEQPTVGEHEAVLWTNEGDPLSWGTAVESTIRLVPSRSPASDCSTRHEQLWNRHTVYSPQ